jgi:hypothetical protein
VHASDTASQTRSSNYSACSATNGARAGNKQLWDYLIAQSEPPASASPAVKAKDAQVLGSLRDKVDAVFAPSDCSQLYGGK